MGLTGLDGANEMAGSVSSSPFLLCKSDSDSRKIRALAGACSGFVGLAFTDAAKITRMRARVFMLGSVQLSLLA